MKSLLSLILLTAMILTLVSNFTLADTTERQSTQMPAADNHEIETGNTETTATSSGASDDEAIEARITNDLLRNPYVDKYQIGVAVVDGAVTLSGSVNTYFEKAQAEEIAASVPGVVIIQNNLRVETE